MRKSIRVSASAACVISACVLMLPPAHAADPAPSQPILLDEISDTNPPSVQQQPHCPLATCGTVISIAEVRGNADVQPGGSVAAPDYYDDNLYNEFDWVNVYGYDVWNPGPVWQIQVRLNSGLVKIVQQNFKPFLHIGDTVVIEGESLRLWP